MSSSKTTEKRSSFLADKARDTLVKLQTDAQKTAFANALKKSISLDIDSVESPVPITVQQLSILYGFSPEVQKSYFIAINKQRAKEFLADMGFPVNANFDRKYNPRKYQELFGREPCIIAGRQMLLTYAEWLHFVMYTFEPRFPKFLEEYLEG